MKKENVKKAKTVDPIPEGFHTVTPYLMVNDADKLIDFLKKGFDATVDFMSRTEDDQVMHAVISVGNSKLMISDAMDRMPETKTMLFVYVDNVDSTFKSALDAKGKSIREVKNEFYGDRAGAIEDPFGNTWWIATHIKDVDEDELQKLAKQESKNQMKNSEEVEA